MNKNKNQQSDFGLLRDIWKGAYPNPEDLTHSLSILERLVMCSLVFVRGLSLSPWIKRRGQTQESRTQASEWYVLIWLALLISFLFLPTCVLFPFLAAYRLIEGFNYRLCIVFVDRYRGGWNLRSLNRSLMLLFINYAEMAIGFAVLYLYTTSILLNKEPMNTAWDAIYFSVVTITTLGDGRFTPASGFGEALICAEAVMGLVFLALVVSMFIGGIPPLANRGPKGGITRRSTGRARAARR